MIIHSWQYCSYNTMLVCVNNSVLLGAESMNQRAVTSLALVVLSPAVLGGYVTHWPSEQCPTEYETMTSYERFRSSLSHRQLPSRLYGMIYD